METTKPHQTNLTKEVHDHQMKHQIAENKISKSTLGRKILEFLVLFVDLDPETNSQNCSSYTREYSRKEGVKWKCSNQSHVNYLKESGENSECNIEIDDLEICRCGGICRPNRAE